MAKINQQKLIKGELSDIEFDSIYPSEIQGISYIHWTPLDVIETAIEWLTESSQTQILDIGSGVGKFCIVGSILSKAQFTGIEKRLNLHEIASNLALENKLDNVTFLHNDIMKVSFRNYSALYYFNPFLEQKVNTGWIDKKIDLSENLFLLYEQYVHDQLSQMPKETKLLTYCSEEFSPPNTYEIRDMAYNGRLILWIKLSD